MSGNEYKFETRVGQGVISITPSNSENFAKYPRAIYVGGAGNISIVALDNSTAVLQGVLAGTVLPIACKRVNSTSTTATNLIGIL